MRNTFGTPDKVDFQTDPKNNPEALTDQVAVVWGNDREVVAALPTVANDGSYDLDIARFPAGFDLTAALEMRRASHGNLAPLSEQTLYLTVVPNFSERTRILALSEEVLVLNDDDLVEWLLNAEKQIALGTDNHPIFETPLADTSCSIVRLPNGHVAMTEVPRSDIHATRRQIRSLHDEADASSFINLSVETQLRCAVRYFLTALPEGAEALREEKESEVTAFFLISKLGFSYGLWSPSMGLFSEYAFPAPSEIKELLNVFNEKLEPSPEAESENPANRHDAVLQNYIRYAFEQLYLQLSQERLDQLGLSNYAQLVWATEGGLSESVAPVAAEYSATTGLEFFQLEVPSDEAVAAGLLFGSFTFGEEVPAGAEILPPVNLARDILVQGDKEEIKRQQLEENQLLKRHNQAVFALTAAPVLVAACLLALILNLIITQTTLGFRDNRAEARTLELKPAVDRRKSYEANLKWYQEFVTQVSRLRQQQPVGIGLLYELNTNYPFNIDPSFYVSDLKLLINGEVEIKGLARNKDAVTSFLRALEFTGGPESGTKLFSNLAYEVQENVVSAPGAVANQAALPTMTGSSITTAGNIMPGVIAWSIKGNYLPAVKFAPPDPTKSPSPKPTPTAPSTPAAEQPTP